LGYGNTGIYIDTLINANGCDSIRTLDLLVHPITDTQLNVFICAPGSYLGYNASGIYVDTLTNANGCDSIRTLNLTVHPYYNKDTSINICEGESYFVGGAWQTVAGAYWDSLKTTFGCDSITRTFLWLKPKPKPDLGPDQFFCKGDSVMLYPGPFQQYVWFNGESNVDRQSIFESGIYYVQVSNFPGCYASDTIQLTQYPEVSAAISSPGKDLCLGDSIILQGYGASIYKWYLNDYLNTPRFVGERFVYIGLQDTKVTLIAEDQNACRDTAEVQLQYINCCGNLAMPNAFSPNGDGRNDLFRPIANARFQKYQFRVFDRWGNQVFESSNLNEGWNGLIKGSQADIGNYFYLLQYQCFGDAKLRTVKGDFVLLR
jgi:gliding motility-associated-like protein